MIGRRTFMKWMIAIWTFVTIPSCMFREKDKQSKYNLKTTSRNPGRAIVIWYSQTGHTARIGRVIANALCQNGVATDTADINDTAMAPSRINDYDLIIIGGPVQYYDIPEKLQKWIKALPSIAGAPVASYVTFGGPEGNQYNASCTTLELLMEKGALPVAMQAFMNMGTMPITWSADHVKESVWNNRILPNQGTYDEALHFASQILKNIENGKVIEVERKITMREISKMFGLIWWTKLMIKDHRIETTQCIDCGRCAADCPVGAIDFDTKQIDTEACCLCFGCLNNCPAGAIKMKYNGKELFSFDSMLKQHKIKIVEPEDLGLIKKDLQNCAKI